MNQETKLGGVALGSSAADAAAVSFALLSGENAAPCKYSVPEKSLNCTTASQNQLIGAPVNVHTLRGCILYQRTKPQFHARAGLNV